MSPRLWTDSRIAESNSPRLRTSWIRGAHDGVGRSVDCRATAIRSAAAHRPECSQTIQEFEVGMAFGVLLGRVVFDKLGRLGLSCAVRFFAGEAELHQPAIQPRPRHA